MSNGLILFGSNDSNLYAVDIRDTARAMALQNGKRRVFLTCGGSARQFISGALTDSFYALETSTGRELWRFRTGDAIFSSPAFSHGAVYFGSSDHHLYSLKAETGDLRWSFETEGPVSSSPAVANGIVYFGSNDGKLYAVAE